MKTKIRRRDFLAGAAGAAAGLSLGTSLTRTARADDNVIKIGWVGAMTGDYAAWGAPGSYGCELWCEMTNAAGGVKVGNKTYMVESVAYDNAFDPTKSVAAAKKFVLEDDARFIMGMWGSPVTSMQPFLKKHDIINASLAPLDMSPDWPNLIAVSEEYPWDGVMPTKWLLDQNPQIKTVSICSVNDESVLQGLAGYRALFEVAGVEIVNDQIYSWDTVDFSPIASAMLAADPDLMCWAASYPDYIDLLSQQAYAQGWEGPMSCLDLSNYRAIVDKTSPEFMEGTVYAIPNMTDPAMQDPSINFPNPAEFERIYRERWPGSWGVVSWLFPAALPVWKAGVEQAGSLDGTAVMETLKSMDEVPHMFGPANWYGEELYGIDNALAGYVPVVQLENSEPKVMDMMDIRPWLAEHTDVFARHMKDLDLI